MAGADVVLSANAATAAVAVAEAALPALGDGAVYADLNTASPAKKQELAAIAGRRFADVALFGPVPEKGLGTPALASGPGQRHSPPLCDRSACRWRSSRIVPATPRR